MRDSFLPVYCKESKANYRRGQAAGYLLSIQAERERRYKERGAEAADCNLNGLSECKNTHVVSDRKWVD